MEKREEALREALANNEAEFQLWETYVKDNETAINNINTFSKRLTVNVMVPIGRKAFIPGRLIHTNEVLVGHYQDYFSKCSALTATEICQRRIENGKQRLEQIEVERDMFENKLEKPYLDGVLPSVEEREIFEEYDEEKEKVWREEHQQRVRKEKLIEKQQRQEELSKQNSPDELIRTLEEEEMLKELNEELAELELEVEHNTEEILNKILSGEMKLPPSKKRIAHNAQPKHESSVQFKPIETNTKVQLVDSTTNHTKNAPEIKFNVQPNSVSDENESDTSTASDIPEEICLIESDASYLPHADRLSFYQYQLQIVNSKLVEFTIASSKELEEKLYLIKVRDHLEELIDIFTEEVSLDTDSQPTDIKESVDKISDNSPKRRISFALENQTLQFKKNETVAQMLPIKSRPQRDIIRLDEPIFTSEQPIETGENDSNKLVDRRKTILEKVEENLKTQNNEDADLVNRIIDSSVNKIQTLHIYFKHSSKVDSCNADMADTEIPATPISPADLYRMIGNKENVDIPANTNANFYLKEADRERAYVDVRSEFMSPLMDNRSAETQSKSILKNKSAVDRETHITEPEEKPKPSKQEAPKPKQQEEEYVSAYDKVMNDVIENITVPDPLPDGKFVDMHMPKKRISRFKQMRNENK